jgi:capsular polysaccharide biosynthesis protein
MDLFNYLQVMRKRWLFTAIGFLLTVGLTVAFVDRQPSVYEAKGTFVIRPRTVSADDDLRAIDTLTRGVEIPSTFATVARSEVVRDRAEQRLDAAIDTSGLSVSSEVVTSTNILEITVRGGDPQAVHALAAAVGDETIVYVADLQRVYDLRALDAPHVPDDPVAPNRPLIIGTGVAFGLGVGIVFALLAEGYARRPKPRQFAAQLSDALQTGRSFSHRYGPIDTTQEEDVPKRSRPANGHASDTTEDLRDVARRSRRARDPEVYRDDRVTRGRRR